MPWKKYEIVLVMIVRDYGSINELNHFFEILSWNIYLSRDEFTRIGTARVVHFKTVQTDFVTKRLV